MRTFSRTSPRDIAELVVCEIVDEKGFNAVILGVEYLHPMAG
jgi:hypothetical protein